MLFKVYHIVLSLLLFVSTTGMTVNLHYCDQTIYDIGILSQAENCCMPSENEHKENKHHACDIEIQQMGDCKNETVHIEHVDDFLNSVSYFRFNKSFVFNYASLAMHSFTDLYNHTSYTVKEINTQDNDPPKLQVLRPFLQTFLL